METITDIIPQRAPFLFADKIESKDDKTIETTLKLTGKEDFFKGHFPGLPIMPGVLMLEACFQAGAALLSGDNLDMIGVVTKVEGAKFKGFAKPGDVLHIHVTLDDQMGAASYMSGKIIKDGKTICACKFAVGLVDKEKTLH